MIWAIAILLLYGLIPQPPLMNRQVNVATIVSRSVKANSRCFESLRDFDYFTVSKKADGSSSTVEEMMLFGSRYSRLVAVNGKPIPPEREAEEGRKLDEVIRLRSRETAEQHSRRVAGYERDRQRDQFLLNEMANAFDFRLVREQLVGREAAYVLRATPRRGYKPPSARARVLTGMEGTLWIDKTTLQWIRVEAEVIRPVSIEGFLARVQPGTQFELDQAPVSGDLLLPTHFSMKSRARILLFFSKHDEEEESYFGYHPAGSSDSR